MNRDAFVARSMRVRITNMTRVTNVTRVETEMETAMDDRVTSMI